MIGYAVLDTETTGINKFHNDRVIEIGIVLLDMDLNIEGTLETVLNPHRDLGATHIHHMPGYICENAPGFRRCERCSPSLFSKSGHCGP